MTMTVQSAVIIGMLVLSIISTIGTAERECFNGQVRRLTSNLLENCYNEEWRWVCFLDDQWNDQMTEATCEQLGYSDSFGLVRGSPRSGASKFVTLSKCNETGLTGCTVMPSDSCTESLLVFLQCETVVCADETIRLVGGRDTDREGRVEVCVGGRRWRTVCTGSQELAGAVCSQMGYIFEESTVALPNAFLSGAFPEYRLDCTQELTNGLWHCSPVEQPCARDSFVELRVVCKNYENLYNECSRNCALSKLPVTTTQSPTTQQVTIPVTSTFTDDSLRSDNSTTLIAVIGVLVALLLAVSVGWIVSCVILLNKTKSGAKQHVDPTISTRSNQSYTQQDINEQLYDEAKPPDQTYSRLNRGQVQDHKMDDIATYDYADHNQIRVECSQATNPPPVSGEAIVREEEFYIAEDHTYAAVNKKAKKKKKKEDGEGDKNNSSL